MMSTRAELSSLRQRNRAAEAERERLREEMAANGERIAVLEARLRDSVLATPRGPKEQSVCASAEQGDGL